MESHIAKEYEKRITNIISNQTPDTNTLWKIKKAITTDDKQNLYAVKDKEGKREFDPEMCKTITMEYYKNLFQQRDIDPCEEKWEESVVKNIEKYGKITVYDTDYIIRPITNKEVTRVMEELKNKKAPGPDRIPNEMIKYGGVALHKVLHSLFKLIFEQNIISRQWNETQIINLYKGKGDPEEMKNQRGDNIKQQPGQSI